MKTDSANDSSSNSKQRQREQVRVWRLAHPSYQRDYQANGGAKVLKIKVPLVQRIKGQLPYSITITNPLKPEERVHEVKKPAPCRREATHDDDANNSLFGTDAENG